MWRNFNNCTFNIQLTSGQLCQQSMQHLFEALKDQKRWPDVMNMSFSNDFEGFLRLLRFPPSSKLTPSLFQFERMQDLPENHFRVSGASWVNIITYLLT